MDLQGIKDLNDASVAMFEEFSKRQRMGRETNIRRLRRVLQDKYGPIDNIQLMETFKALEKAGYGSLVIGRGEKPSRFMWQYSLREVAQAAQTGKKPVHKIEPKVEPKKIEEKPQPTKIQVPELNLFVLKEGRMKRYRITDRDTVASLSDILDAL